MEYSKYKTTPKATHIGRIPSHWKTKKLRHLGRTINGISAGAERFGSGTPFVSYSDVFGNETIPSDIRGFFMASKEEQENYSVIEGDVLFTRTSETAEDIAISSTCFKTIPKSTFAGFLIRFRPDSDQELSKEFSRYYFRSECHKAFFNKEMNLVTRVSLGQDLLKKLPVVLPPLDEQKQIADFLDWKTGQIDALIAKQQLLIEKLKEQRIAVITQAVTKGVNPDAPMRDSSIPWLDCVPEAWKLTKLRFMFEFGRGLGITKANLVDSGIPCINYGEIHSKFGFEVIPETHDLKFVSEEYLETGAKSLLSHGEFVFADTSEDIEGSGNFSYLNSETPTFAGYHTVTAKPLAEYNPRFIAYLFDSLPFRYQIRKNISGVKVFSITQSLLKSCAAWLPRIDEQSEIVDYLDLKCSKMDRVTLCCQSAIKKLTEYRAAITTAATTGKIDVRDVKVPPAA